MSARPDPRAPPLVSVVIPTLDEEAELPGVLEHLAFLPGRWEAIVADGGSSDRTVQIACERGAGIVARGVTRAAQLNAAAAAARGEVLLFLHADSRLPSGAHGSIVAALRDPALAGGNFALSFDGGDRFARMLTAAYALQRRFGFYYGDSSIWVRREVFERLGGFRELPIMDEYDFVRRLERAHRTTCLPGPARTSPRRWRALGVPRTLLSLWAIRLLFIAGVPPRRLAALYRRIR